MNALTTVNTAPAMTVSDVERVALAIAKGGLFGSKDPNAVLTLCLLAQAEGQHPAVVFRDYHIIQGKPAKKAEAMLRDFINSGGKVEWHTLDDTCADATFTHPSGSARIDWTLDRAKQAGISTAMWSKYPRQMLRSRVISEGVRTVFPGATSGLYVPEEVSTFEPSETPHDEVTGEIIEPVKEPAAREVLDGPHTSKTALRKAVNDLITNVRKAETIEAVDMLKSTHKRTINQALRDWPSLIDGDPNIGEDLGLKGEIDKRRAELARVGPTEESEGLSMLAETLEACTSETELSAWFKLNWKYADELAADEQDRIKALYDEKEAALKAAAPTPLTEGAFGG